MSPSTTARPDVMYSNAKPLALARSTRQPRESSSGCGGLAAQNHVGAGQADAEPRVGRALDEESPALGAVGERLADRAVDALAGIVAALHDRDDPAQHRLADAVLGAALDADHQAPGVEGAEPLARDGATVELELGEHVLGALGGAVVDAGARQGSGQLGPEHAVVGVGRPREILVDRGAAADVARQGGDLRRGVRARHADRAGADQAGLGACLGRDQVLLGDGHVHRRQLEVLLERGDQRSQVEGVGVRWPARAGRSGRPDPGRARSPSRRPARGPPRPSR